MRRYRPGEIPQRGRLFVLSPYRRRRTFRHLGSRRPQSDRRETPPDRPRAHRQPLASGELRASRQQLEPAESASADRPYTRGIRARLEWSRKAQTGRIDLLRQAHGREAYHDRYGTSRNAASPRAHSTKGAGGGTAWSSESISQLQAVRGVLPNATEIGGPRVPPRTKEPRGIPTDPTEQWIR